MTSDPVHYLSLTDVSERLRRGELRPTALSEMILARIARHDGALKSYTTLLADRAMAKARQAEEELDRGLWRGPLHGVPIAVKDLCYTDYAPTAAGMLIHKDFIPPYTCTVVERLERAGAIILGKLSMTEGAFAIHHPGHADTGQSLACGRLDRRVVERVGSGDGGGTVLRIARLRYRRIDPLPVSGLRADGSQADLGPGQPLRRLPAVGIARSHRADDAHRGRLRGDAGGDRRRRPARSHRAARARARLRRRSRRRHSRTACRDRARITRSTGWTRTC